MNEPSAELLARFQAGDEEAATALFERYVERLTRLARSRLSARLAARTDPEDVVQSAYRSFFIGAREGRFTLERSGDLWRLLVSITLHKLHRGVQRHLAQRRTVDAEQQFDGPPHLEEIAVSQEATPEAAAALADELEVVMAALKPFERRVLELRLQGEQVTDIAIETGRSERTVRRALASIRSLLASRLRSADGEPRIERQVKAKPAIYRAAQKALRKPIHIAGDAQAPLPYGDYLLQQQIGTGATGKVYRALHKSLDRTVAVKYLRKSVARQPAAIERFVGEAEIVGRFDHCGIVAVHGLGRTPHGGYFIVMDYVAGGDLAVQMECGALPIEAVVAWMTEGCAAIQYAHEQGIVHCDLKPSNLLLDEAGHVRVTDFGLARSLEAGGESLLSIAGTASYMAAEQVAEDWGPIGPHTDVYGLGAVLYALLTGRPPHVGDRISDILADVLSGRHFPVPRDLRSDVPEWVNAICLKCLSRSPDRRFASAAELGEALGRRW